MSDYDKWSKGMLESELKAWARGSVQHTMAQGALDKLIAREQAHDDEILEKHHEAVLEQNERHHREELNQQERHFRETKRSSNISNTVAIVAALSAMAAAYFAGESAQQSKTSQASPLQIQLQQQRIPNASDHPTVSFEQPSPSAGIYHASNQSPIPPPVPQQTPQQSPNNAANPSPAADRK